MIEENIELQVFDKFPFDVLLGLDYQSNFNPNITDEYRVYQTIDKELGLKEEIRSDYSNTDGIFRNLTSGKRGLRPSNGRYYNFRSIDSHFDSYLE